jgi:hypothetical protein
MAGRSSEIQPDKFMKRFDERWGDAYKVVSEFLGTKKQIEVFHVECGRTFSRKRSNDAILSPCPLCFGKNSKKRKISSQSDFVRAVEEVHGGRFVILGIYSGMSKLVRAKCTRCGYESEKDPSHMLRGTGCASCKGRAPLNNETFMAKVSSLPEGTEYELTGDYKNDETKVTMLHRKCGEKFDVEPNHFVTSETRCPYCNRYESSGEKLVREALKSMGLEFSRQHTFDGCRREKKLRFDFAVLSSSNSPVLLIEFDGEQHYRPIGMFGGEKNLEYTRENDRIKEEYCALNGHKLIRLRESDIPEIRTKIEAALAETRRS